MIRFELIVIPAVCYLKIFKNRQLFYKCSSRLSYIPTFGDDRTRTDNLCIDIAYIFLIAVRCLKRFWYGQGGSNPPCLRSEIPACCQLHHTHIYLIFKELVAHGWIWTNDTVIFSHLLLPDWATEPNIWWTSRDSNPIPLYYMTVTIMRQNFTFSIARITYLVYYWFQMRNWTPSSATRSP